MKDVSLPLPNIYFASIQSATTGETHHMYIAADFSLAAIRKVGRLCADRHGFRPYRGNSVIKLRRFKLMDYLQAPEAVTAAMANAHHLGELDTVEALTRRPAEVASLLEPHAQVVDFDAAMARLQDELAALDQIA